MEPDPLLERLDTVLGEDSEKLGFVPTDLPPAVEDILEALKSQTGVDSISLGRQVYTRRKFSGTSQAVLFNSLLRSTMTISGLSLFLSVVMVACCILDILLL